MIDYEKIIKKQRLTSRTVFLQILPLCTVGMVGAAHMTGMVFMGYNQDHICTMPRQQEIREDCNIIWREQQTHRYIPWNEETESYDSCTRYVHDSINCTLWRSNDTRASDNDTTIIAKEKCDSWTYDTSVFKTTVLGDFNLVCDSRQKGRLSQAIFMLGVTLGVSVWGQISDKFGRKVCTITPLVIGVGVGIATAFSNSFILFTILRFFFGFTFYPACANTYVLSTEGVRSDQNVLVSQIYEITFAIGICALAGVGYLVRDWRRLQIWITAPGIIYIVWLCTIFESPRWLLAKKRYAEADTIVRKLLTTEEYQQNSEARRLQSLCQTQDYKNESANMTTMMTSSVENEEKSDEMSQNNSENRTYMDIMKRPNLRKRSFILYYIWMTVSALYYGLTLNAADLGGNVFLNLLISALVEIPAALLSIPMMDKWGRRPTFTLSLLLSGAVCICMMFVSKELVWLNVMLSTIGKFSISSGFGVAYVYAIEVYPTPVRNVGIGVCNSCARIGGMLAPFIAMLDAIGFAVPYVAFGLMALLGGTMITFGVLSLFLPETLRKTCPETLEEAEEFGKDYEGIMALLCRQKTSTVIDDVASEELKRMNTI